MSPSSLPALPNLEQLKKQARDLLKAYRSGQPPAIARLRESLPPLFGAARHRPRLTVTLRLRRLLHGCTGVRLFNRSPMHTHARNKGPAMLELTVERKAVNRYSQQRVVVPR